MLKLVPNVIKEIADVCKYKVELQRKQNKKFSSSRIMISDVTLSSLSINALEGRIAAADLGIQDDPTQIYENKIGDIIHRKKNSRRDHLRWKRSPL